MEEVTSPYSKIAAAAKI